MRAQVTGAVCLRNDLQKRVERRLSKLQSDRSIKPFLQDIERMYFEQAHCRN